MQGPFGLCKWAELKLEWYNVREYFQSLWEQHRINDSGQHAIECICNTRHAG